MQLQADKLSLMSEFLRRFLRSAKFNNLYKFIAKGATSKKFKNYSSCKKL